MSRYKKLKKLFLLILTKDARHSRTGLHKIINFSPKTVFKFLRFISVPHLRMQ